MYKFEVGQLFKEGITRYQEGVRFDFLPEGPVLLIYFNAPSMSEINDIKQGKSRFGLFVKDNIIFFLSKFGSLAWMDAPYSIHLTKEKFDIEAPSSGEGYALNVFLIDAKTGILKAARLIGLSTKVSLSLLNAINAQRSQFFDLNNYSTKLQSLYNNYSTNDMVKFCVME